jgi:hypothetical protein
MKRYISPASLPWQAATPGATPTRKPSKMPRTLLALYLETLDEFGETIAEEKTFINGCLSASR